MTHKLLLLVATPTATEIIIIFLPATIFLIVFWVIFRKLRTDGVTLKDLLLDKDMIVAIKKEETKQKESYNATASALLAKGIPAESAKAALLNEEDPTPTPSPTTPQEQQSVSRLLAFISGLVSVGLACCITTFYIWGYVKDGKVPDLNSLVNILLALGMGVVPYAVNKLSGALK